MNLHFVTEKETSAVRSLWETCFKDPPEFTDFYFKKRYDFKNAVAIIKDEQVASMLQMFPYNMNVRGKHIKCGFLVGVATHPKFRRRGYMRFLIEQAFHIMELRGEYISCLYPAESYGMYREFGYEVITSSCRYNLENRHIPLYSGDYVLAPLNHTHHRAAVKKCYDTYMQGFSGYVERSINDWQFKFGDWKTSGCQGMACFRKDGAMAGYAVFEPRDEETVVHETAFTDIGAFECLMNALSMSGAKLSVTLSERSRPADAMDDGRGIVTLNPYLMGRILNVKAFMKKLPIMDAKPVTIELADHLEGNYGVFTLSATGLKSSYDDPELTMDMRCFTQIAFGYVSAVQAFYNGKIKGSLEAAKRLNDLLPKVDTFCMDMY